MGKNSLNMNLFIGAREQINVLYMHPRTVTKNAFVELFNSKARVCRLDLYLFEVTGPQVVSHTDEMSL